MKERMMETSEIKMTIEDNTSGQRQREVWRFNQWLHIFLFEFIMTKCNQKLP
jgi:hypothetical protein